MNRFAKILFEDSIRFGIKALIVFVMVLLIAFIGSAIVFNNANNSSRSTFEVTGKAKKEVVPDKAVLTVGTVVEGSDVATIQTQANQKINDTLEEFTKSGIKKENIKTSQYNIQPKYSTDSKISGYSITVSLQITFENIGEDTKPISDAISSASLKGLNNVYGLNFVISEYDKITEELKVAAIEDGKSKKDSLAKASGLRLGKLKDVQVGGYYYPQYFATDGKSTAPARDSATPSTPTTPIKINPGKNEIEVSVTLIYEID